MAPFLARAKIDLVYLGSIYWTKTSKIIALIKFMHNHKTHIRDLKKKYQFYIFIVIRPHTKQGNFLPQPGKLGFGLPLKQSYHLFSFNYAAT
jgi:hypothetical protein